MTRRHLDAALLVGCRVLDERDEAARHEAAGTDGNAGPGHLADLDHAAGGHDLDPPARSRRHDVEGLDALPRIDDGLDSIAFHGRTIVHATQRRNGEFADPGRHWPPEPVSGE